jgi:hypothetical protein
MQRLLVRFVLLHIQAMIAVCSHYHVANPSYLTTGDPKRKPWPTSFLEHDRRAPCRLRLTRPSSNLLVGYDRETRLHGLLASDLAFDVVRSWLRTGILLLDARSDWRDVELHDLHLAASTTHAKCTEMPNRLGSWYRITTYC